MPYQHETERLKIHTKIDRRKISTKNLLQVIILNEILFDNSLPIRKKLFPVVVIEHNTKILHNTL